MTPSLNRWNNARGGRRMSEAPRNDWEKVDQDGGEKHHLTRSRAWNRRALLGTASLGVGTLSLGTLGLWRDVARAQTQTPIPDTTPWVEPPQRISRNGLLKTVLNAGPDLSAGLGKMSYEGSIPGPTLRVRPG